MRIDHGGHGVGRVVKSVHELEAQRGQQRDAQKKVGKSAGRADARNIGKQTDGGIRDARDQDDAKDQHSCLAGRLV